MAGSHNHLSDNMPDSAASANTAPTYSFKVYGHSNIRGAHKNTFEFTKDKDVSPRGDCIIGVRATFDAAELKRVIQKNIIRARKSISSDNSCGPSPSQNKVRIVIRAMQDRTMQDRTMQDRTMQDRAMHGKKVVEEQVLAWLNPNFSADGDEKEFVVRIGSFASSRTFAVCADKSAALLNRDIVDLMTLPGQEADVFLFFC